MIKGSILVVPAGLETMSGKQRDHHNILEKRMVFSDLERLVFTARAGNSQEIKLLLDVGANPDGPDGNLGAPLFAALAGHDSQVVRILLENRASVDVTDQFGDGPLEYALHHSDAESVFELLEYGAKLRVHTKNTYQLLLEQMLKRREPVIK